MKYSIDTSAVLDGWRRHYPIEVFPTLWDRLAELISDGSLQATEEVRIELEKRDDEVFEWCNSQNELFVSIDEDIQDHVSSMLQRFPKLIDTRRNRSSADPFVIGLAMVNSFSVVTGERPTGSVDRPNIPDVCDAFDITTLSLLDLIRIEGWRFT